MIEASNLTKKFRKQVAVDDISFKVQTGKVTGFLGPNGAGKSTTMRLMLGLDNGKGHTTYDGKYLTQFKKPGELVGILLEAKAFHPTRSARNHLKILASAGGIPHSRVDEVLDVVGLKSVAKKGPGKFSLGMSQRLGIAAAILGKPKYLILDEPANGLDPEGIVWLREFLKEYADQGNGVFVSSHLLSEMSQLADNVLVIGKGKIIANTSIDELTSGGSHISVFVRSPKPELLAKALTIAKIEFTKKDGGISVKGRSTDEIGKIAFDKKIPLLELAAQRASLEDVFLELTAESQEYHGHTEGEAKK